MVSLLVAISLAGAMGSVDQGPWDCSSQVACDNAWAGFNANTPGGWAPADTTKVGCELVDRCPETCPTAADPVTGSSLGCYGDTACGDGSVMDFSYMSFVFAGMGLTAPDSIGITDKVVELCPVSCTPGCP